MSDRTDPDDDKHPIQTDAPHRLDGDSEVAEAALKELNHYIWRADTPPDKSTLDPNLNRCKEHLQALGRSLGAVGPLEEKCPTCGEIHTAGSLRTDQNGDLRCPMCIDDEMETNE